MSQNVLFIDSRVTDYASLIAGLGADTEWYLLDTASNGVSQMLAKLEGRAGLASIQIVSHGEPGGILLGNGLLDAQALQAHSAELAALGDCLAEEGDLLLYGCNVAQGEVGQAFVQSLAALTGADVAASVDLTGGQVTQGDTELEYLTGQIETATLDLSNTTATLATEYTSSISFSGQDLSLFGVAHFAHTFGMQPDGSIDGPVFSMNTLTVDNTANQPSFLGMDLHADFSISNFWAGIPISLTATTGSYDFDYGINAFIETPSTVVAGDEIIVNTYMLNVDAASLSVSGPELSLSAALELHANIDGFIQLDDENDDPVVFDPLFMEPISMELSGSTRVDVSAELFSWSTNDLEPIESSKMVTLTESGNWRWTNDVLGGRTVYKAPLMSMGFNLDPNITGSSDTLTAPSAQLIDLSAEARPDNPLAWLQVDVDDLAALLAGGATTPVGNLLRELDRYYRVKDAGLYDSFIDVEAGLLSVDSRLEFYPIITADIDVLGINVTLESSTGESKTGRLGDSFTFSTPSSQSSAIEITASYSLDYSLKPSLGLMTSGGFVIKLGELEGIIMDKEYDLTLMDFNLPANEDGSLKDLFSFDYELDTRQLQMLSGAQDTYSIQIGSATDNPGGEDPVIDPVEELMSIRSVPSTKQMFPGHSMGEWQNSGAFAALRADGSVVTWGDSRYGGDSSAVVAALNGQVDVVEVFSNPYAFAALRTDGSVVAWGDRYHGGDFSAVAGALNGQIKVVEVFAAEDAFAALRADGSVVTWGDSRYGGDSSAVAAALDGQVDVVEVFSATDAFAALRADGSVVTWGYGPEGGNSSIVTSALDGKVDVVEVFPAADAFAALRVDGSVVTWGWGDYGGNSSTVASALDGQVDVVEVFSTGRAFAALRADGSVVTWGGAGGYGGNSSTVASELDGRLGVVEVFATGAGFAALRTDGSVVTWGDSRYGGDSSAVAGALDGRVDVIEVFSNSYAFAALRTDGSVITWGDSYSGGNSSAVASALNGSVNVLKVFSTGPAGSAFAALRADGSVVTWGSGSYGGDSSAVASALDGQIDVVNVFSTGRSFAALRADGSVVTWGGNGGDSSTVASALNGNIDVIGISDIYSREDALPVDVPVNSISTLQVADLTLNEGNTSKTATLTISLNAPATQELWVDYSSQSGSTSAGEDYRAAMGSLRIAKGATSASIELQVLGDTLHEANESFTLSLQARSGAEFAGGGTNKTVSINLLNDDPQQLPTLSLRGSVAVEGQFNNQAPVTVLLSEASTQSVSVNWHTESLWINGLGGAEIGNDFPAQSGTLTFAPGETRAVAASECNTVTGLRPEPHAAWPSAHR